MKTTPFWTDEYTKPPNLQLSNLPEKVDVAIVGSGYTGLNAAITFAKTGVNVVVLEQETIGWGASSRNGSFVSPSLKAKWKTIEKNYGREQAISFWKWALDSVNYVSNIIQVESIDCDYQRTGMLGVATKPTHFEDFQAYCDYLRETFGYDGARIIPRLDLHKEIGSSIYYGGMTSELGYRVHPAKYVYGLAEVATKCGARLVEFAEVQQLRGNGNRLLLKTSKGDVLADQVLLATGGYTTKLLRKARNGIFPVGSYMIVTEPLSKEMQSSICPTGRLFYDSKIFLNYFGLTPDGRAFIGGRANLSPNLNLTTSGNLLHTRLVEIFPQLTDVDITHSWSGKLGVSFDQMPHIGHEKRVYYAYGYSGQGVSTGSYMGVEVAELMMGSRRDSAFMKIKHPQFFFASLDRFYLPIVSTYFKAMDRIF